MAYTRMTLTCLPPRERSSSSTAARALLFLMCWTNLAFPWSFSFIAELYLLLGIL